MAVASKAGIFNIGIEGQILAGALPAALAGTYITGLPAVLHIPVCILVAAISVSYTHLEYSLESIPDAGWEITEYTFDLHNSPMAEGNVMTEYEMKFASEGKPICKLIARRTSTCGQGPA